MTTAQFRNLTRRMKAAPAPREDRDLNPADLRALGYSAKDAQWILSLLSEEERLSRYLERGKKAGFGLLTLHSGRYPRELEARLGEDAPSFLWYLGDPGVLDGPKVSLVGSRDLYPENANFARLAGSAAAQQGFTLVSGNARGADKTAQEGCLSAGGRVISIVADALERHNARDGMLYLSEDSFDLAFSAQRALSRNRCIHALGEKTFVAQCTLEQGGTWDGTVKNLRQGLSPVYVFADGSEASATLDTMGALSVLPQMLGNIGVLPVFQGSLFD
jgi:predicted Rossmann fold nucleotide-binding protein DprA/Smf involved in DNA uptake